MKTLNLVMAIIYTVFLSLLALSGIMDGDSELVVGTLMLSAPTVVNWITYTKLKSNK